VPVDAKSRRKRNAIRNDSLLESTRANTIVERVVEAMSTIVVKMTTLVVNAMPTMVNSKNLVFVIVIAVSVL
jgi:hypothetical protein